MPTRIGDQRGIMAAPRMHHDSRQEIESLLALNYAQIGFIWRLDFESVHNLDGESILMSKPRL
jgi:hypothetical protein